MSHIGTRPGEKDLFKFLHVCIVVLIAKLPYQQTTLGGKGVKSTALGKTFFHTKKIVLVLAWDSPDLTSCILGPVHMHTFTSVSKDTYVSKFTYGVM